jgi:glycosyltransferase involved in cell wall biosynthesis
LAEINAPVVLFCPSNFQYLRGLNLCGVQVFAAGPRGVELSGFAARILRNIKFLFWTSLHQFRATKRGDIVHFQFPVYFPFGLVFFLLAAIKNCPIVFTVHDPLPHKWLFPERFRGIERTTLACAYKLSQRIVVHNETGRRTLIEHFGLNPQKVSVISHGPFSLSGSNQSLPRLDRLRLLLFGSIRENKGIHLAIEAVQMLNTRFRTRVDLTIAGQVANAREEDYWGRCKAKIEKQPEGIHILERYIPDAELGLLLGNHHAVVLPYLDYTSESGVASLALSNRRGILATRVGGLETLLTTCECGIAIESPTVEGVADAISMVLEGGRPMLERMGAEGKAFLSSTRSWRQISLETLTLYTELLSGKSSKWSGKESPVAHSDAENVE